MKRTKTNYYVMVGNVGQVHSGHNRRVARSEYLAYVKISKQGTGRAGHEQVTLFADAEILAEFDYQDYALDSLQRKICASEKRLKRLRDEYAAACSWPMELPA